MKRFLQQVLRRNAYFILAAAWLITIAFIVNDYWASFHSVSHLRSSIERDIQKQEKDFDLTIADTSFLNKLVTKNYGLEELNRMVKKPYGFYLYEPGIFGLINLKFWNNQYALPTPAILEGKSSNGMIKLKTGQYEYILRHLDMPNNKKLVVIALIPVYKEYYIQIQSFKREFVNHPEAEKFVSISADENDYPVKSRFGNNLFYLDSKTTNRATDNNWVSLTLSLLGILLLSIFIHNVAVAIAGKRHYIRGTIFLVTVILLLRGLTYVFPRLLKLDDYELFDPTVYSSGLILNSLGDLLINSILFCWVVLFIKQVCGRRTFASLRNSRWSGVVLGINILLLVLLTLGEANVIKSLIADGRISFNVTNFFTLNGDSFIGFLVLACIAFAYFFLSRIILRMIDPLLREKEFLLYLITAIAGLTLLTAFRSKVYVELNISALLWLLAYEWLMQRKSFSALYSKLNISAVLFWLFIFSISISVIIMYENRNLERYQIKRSAVKLSDASDPARESLLNIALIYIDNDFLDRNFFRFQDNASNAFLKDSLINQNFSPYLNVFETRIYTFDALKAPLYNQESISYDTLNTIFQIDGKMTSVRNLRYFEKSIESFSYIFRKATYDTSGKLQGFFFIVINPRQFKPDALVPELFRQGKNYLPEYSPVYSYAIYNKLRLIKYYNDYQFATTLNKSDIPDQQYKVIDKDGYEEVWYKDGADKIVVFSHRDNYLIEAITLFAYIFSSFLLLVAIFSIIALLVQSRLKLAIIRQYWQLNIRSQIHGTIIFISLFSFVVIGVATIFFFNNRYEKNNQERISKVIHIMATDIRKKLSDSTRNDLLMNAYDGSNDNGLRKMLEDVAEIHNAEVILYDLNGNLLVATNPLLYSEGILSEKMNPIAYYYMTKARMVQYINQEQAGDVEYQSIYSPVTDANMKPYAYLNIPSFVSQEELKREISNFLVTIINLNAFIFLVAGVIALFITNRITSSFHLIGHKMREINLGKLNEEILWNRDDEIGGLVKEYNKMVVKLGESALALAKSEREGAWREMARQVAHEIKNPLTPMKLSIQYLQKVIDNDSVNVKELSSNVAKTLIEQIDHLSKIAADFSQFANIGNVRNEVFDLHEMLYSLTSLYESMENLTLTWQPSAMRVLVRADKTQLNRLFTNLFQNALEACTDLDHCVIEVSEKVHGDKITIQIRDNGEGIPLAMQSRIFTPNFTTKSSGTGLGLAMSKTIVEQARGTIWFETLEGQGTSFFVQLPITRLFT
ncbi:MAG: HAMP domain-containing sensor histidine kinase [Chitinophagaceae bacterium]